MATIQRREFKNHSLSPELQILERSLIARASDLEHEVAQDIDGDDGLVRSVRNLMANQFRLLAEEMHHW
jgi:hypothetical protein